MTTYLMNVYTGTIRTENEWREFHKETVKRLSELGYAEDIKTFEETCDLVEVKEDEVRQKKLKKMYEGCQNDNS